MAQVFAPFGYSFIGKAEVSESGGEAPSPSSNPFVAVAQDVWPGAKTTSGWKDKLRSINNLR